MKKLLFVEDDIITGSIYRYHFTSAGYQVELADDGEKALAALGRFKPDVVVLDLLLPKVNGLEILKRIRAQPETMGLPVIVFTNAFASDMAREAENAGATQCLSKAKIGAPALLSAIQSALADSTHTPPVITASARVLDPSELEETPYPVRAAAEPAFIHPKDEFLKRTPETLAEMRRLIQRLLTENRNEARPALVLALQIKVHSLTSTAALAHAFAHVTVLDTSSFMKTMMRKRAALNGHLDWLPAPTDEGAPVDGLFAHNVNAVQTWIGNVITSRTPR